MGLLTAFVVAALLVPPMGTAQSTTTPPPGTAVNCCSVLSLMSTTSGDGGLWLTPSPETIGQGVWSAGAYRFTFNRREGRSNIAYLGVSGSLGLTPRTELFGTWRADTRLDRDSPDPPEGGPNEHPFAVASWPGDVVGDLLLGLKVNVTSYHRSQPIGIAVRAGLHLPTGHTERGIGTGRTGWWADLVLGRPLGRRMNISASVGTDQRGRPDGVPVGRSVRLGGATALLVSESRLVSFFGTAEAVYDQIVGDGPSWVSRSYTDIVLGLLGRTRSGFYAGAGVRFTPKTTAYAGADLQVTLGYRIQ